MSRHVGGLEELLGKQLFVRDASRLSLTAAGEELLPVVSKCLDRLEQTMNSIRDDEVTGRSFRLHVPPSLLQQLFLPMLRDFHAENPDIRLDVSSAHVTGLPPTDFDMAIAYDRPNVDDRVTDLLWMVRVAPLCSAQSASHSLGKTLAEFLENQELLHLKLDGQPRDLLWTAYLRQSGLAVPTQEIADGRLVMPYDAVIEDGYGYYLKLHADDLGDPAISMFRSWLISRFGALRRAPRLDGRG